MRALSPSLIYQPRYEIRYTVFCSNTRTPSTPCLTSNSPKPWKSIAALAMKTIALSIPVGLVCDHLSRIALSFLDESDTSLWYLVKRGSSAFVKVQQPGIALFLVCRQIYDEASSVFYKHNTFAISRVCVRHKTVHDYNGKRIIEAAVSWLRQLGSRAVMLRKLEIDFDTMCPSNCRPGRRNCAPDAKKNRSYIDFWPLISFLWSSGLQIEIVLVQSQNKLHNEVFDTHREWHSLEVRRGICVPALNTLLRNLLSDGLGIRKYWRTIGTIIVSRRGHWGIVAYTSTSTFHLAKGTRRTSPSDLTSKFRIQPDILHAFEAYEGRKPCLLSHTPPTFAALPSWLRCRILDKVLVYPALNSLSIETSPQLLTQINQASVCREWMKHYNKQFMLNDKFIIEVKATSRMTQLLELNSLVSLLRTATGPYTFHPPKRPSSQDPFSCSVSITYELDENWTTAPEDVIFDATPLLLATLDRFPAHDVKIAITVPTTATDTRTRTTLASYSFTMLQLRANILAAWTQRNAESSTQLTLCPQIWVNGRGVFVDVVESTTWYAPKAADLAWAQRQFEMRKLDEAERQREERTAIGDELGEGGDGSDGQMHVLSTLRGSSVYEIYSYLVSCALQA